MVESHPTFRDSPHLTPDQSSICDKPAFVFPPPDKLSFDNPVVGFMHRPGMPLGLNVIMKDGTKSEMAYRCRPEKEFEEVKLKPDDIVSKVVMWGHINAHHFWGV